jgi:hypothetical protein
VNSEHNHDVIHKYAERLRPEEKELVRGLRDNMAAPRNIMSTLKKRRVTTATTMNTYIMHDT